MKMNFEDEFNKFINCVHKAGGLKDIIVIGSWAEYLYQKSNVLKDFRPLMQTIDLDFLIPNINKPREKINLIEIAKENGFLYEEDITNGISRFIGRGNFEVEFLASQKGSGEKLLPRTTIGVNAQQLTHLNVLIENTIKIDYNALNINIPKPEAYVLQKMIINDRRKLKMEKDKEKIISIIPYLDKQIFNEIKNTLTKKEKNLVENFIEKNNIIFNNITNDKNNEEPLVDFDDPSLECHYDSHFNDNKSKDRGIER